jgi:cupin 2 domain-containing protein
VKTGRLPDDPAPDTGERFDEIIVLGAVRVELITSSSDPDPTPYRQEHGEWVLVLDGSATLEVEGETVDLVPGSWVSLPTRTPHRVRRTSAGTRWLALHVERAPDP